MKKKLTLVSLLFTLAFPALFGQTLQVGMRWEYIADPLIGFPLPSQYLVSLEVTGDTVVQGKTYFQVPEFTCNFSNPTLIREEGSKVFYHHEGEEYLLYDYSLNPGDTLWQTYWNQNEEQTGFEIMSYPLQIIDTSSIFLGGTWRKMQFIHHNASDDGIFNDIGGLFIEGFGSTFFFFPQYIFCETDFCLRAIYWPNGDSTLVDSLTNCFIIDKTKEIDLSSMLSIAPNPVQNMLHLQAGPGLSPEAQVVVFDLYGRQVYTGTFAEAEKGIPAQNWPPGVYFLEVRDGGRTGALRFAK